MPKSYARSEDANIVVVGAGVAGSSAAYVASRLGADVRVLEEHDEPGHPAHCSGHVGIGSLKRLGIQIPKNIIQNEIRGAIFHSPLGTEFTVRQPKPVTWVLDRARFDQHLADLAMKAGARFDFGRKAEALTLSSSGRSRVHVRGSKPLTCRLVIDAEGSGAYLARQAGLSRINQSYVVNGAQVVAKATDFDPQLVELFFGQSYAPEFFSWLIPISEEKVKVGLAARRTDPSKLLQKLLEKHPSISNRIIKVYDESLTYHPIPLYEDKGQTFADGLLVAGDAASQVKPTTGGGIVFGLICGKLAGQTAYEAVVRNEFSSSFLSSYEARWRSVLGFHLGAMRWLRRTVLQMGDIELDQFFRIVKRLKLPQVLEQYDDIDFQGRTLLTLSRDPKYLVLLLFLVVKLLQGHRIFRRI